MRWCQDNASRAAAGEVGTGMRFALLGNHPDGVEMALALVASGRYQLAAYTAPIVQSLVQAGGEAARKCQDLEEVLADPQVELVIVAGVAANRPAQLRRALQAERHVLAVHPCDRTPEVAYEAGMIQKDTGYVLLPLLSEALHPGVARLKDLIGQAEDSVGSETLLGSLRLVEVSRPPPSATHFRDTVVEEKPTFPGWDVCRALGGEIAEVSAFANREEARASEPLLVSGRFERGGLLQLILTPIDEDGCRLVVHGTRGRAELYFPQGWRGPAFLNYDDKSGPREETWGAWDPRVALIERFDGALKRRESRTGTAPPELSQRGATAQPPDLSWEDEIRCLELDDATRRSVEKRRSSVLEYQEASEEVGFKGTMTLVGCALMWGLLALLFVVALLAQGLKSSKSTLAGVLPQGVEAATCVGLLFGLPLVGFLLLQLLRIFAQKKS
jgi:predicted dehydrogenase